MELGLEATGNKEALVSRLLGAYAQQQPLESQDSAAMNGKVEDDVSAGEVHILREQVAHLQQELAAMTQRLSAADAARAAERAQLDELTVAMTQLRSKYEEHAQQVAAAEVAALNVQQGAAELEAMREEQKALSQRIAFLQGLLQERESEIDLLRMQLSEFQVEAKVGATAGGQAGGTAVMDMPGGSWPGASLSSLNAAQQASSTRVAAASGGGFSRRIGCDSELAEVGRSGPPSANGSAPRIGALDVTKRHTAPGLLVLAGALGFSRAWRDLKRSLPKEQRISLDITTIALCGALAAIVARS
ncbi:hypothetical protein COCOBI_09-5320 [Coccomyxa sp. Obi]|nr:hypothetical protein COCOBI_09-5320 [Coccomyxa sp. Obi]